MKHCTEKVFKCVHCVVQLMGRQDRSRMSCLRAIDRQLGCMLTAAAFKDNTDDDGSDNDGLDNPITDSTGVFTLDRPKNRIRPARVNKEGSKCDVSIRGLGSALEACEAATTKDNIQKLKAAWQECVETGNALRDENARSDIRKLDAVLHELSIRINICFGTGSLKSALVTCEDASTLENIEALKQAVLGYKELQTYVHGCFVEYVRGVSGGLTLSNNINHVIDAEFQRIKDAITKLEMFLTDLDPRIRVYIPNFRP